MKNAFLNISLNLKIYLAQIVDQNNTYKSKKFKEKFKLSVIFLIFNKYLKIGKNYFKKTLRYNNNYRNKKLIIIKQPVVIDAYVEEN